MDDIFDFDIRQNFPFYIEELKKEKLENFKKTKRSVYINKIGIEVEIRKFYKPISTFIDFNDV